MSKDKEARIAELKNHAATNQTFARAKKIAKVHQWQVLAQHDDYIWGIALGSRGSTYNVRCVVTDEIVFGDDVCSCPSRERPCKHGIALAMLFIQDDEPWLTEAPSSEFLSSIEESADLGQRATRYYERSWE